MSTPSTSNIFVEEAKVLDCQTCPGDQFILRLYAPRCAAHALPGNFVHLRCDPLLPMRRPLSIMRVSTDEGWIELLFKRIGQGTHFLANRRRDESLSTLGPIGNPFSLHKEYPLTVLIGGGVGIPPIIFLADQLRHNKHWIPLVFMGSEIPFPFWTRQSQTVVPSIPQECNSAMSLLEDWGIPSRLASLQGYAGCYPGHVTELARQWLSHQNEEQRGSIEIFACGPLPMLRAATDLAREFRVPCQVSLEEYMACGVGGCAGCVVRVNTEQGPRMKRVCVDGPVFNATEIF